MFDIFEKKMVKQKNIVTPCYMVVNKWWVGVPFPLPTSYIGVLNGHR